MLKKVFIVGFGYVGQRLAGRLLEQDINVTAQLKMLTKNGVIRNLV
ncbi:MAG: hypothetical protein ACNYPI_02445 [Arenicellales bacterium WSBS_2016_MAG_OTU3]